jgi:glycosyltransferase involved in cell wall biosynthesis
MQVDSAPMKVTVIIPAINESQTIGQVVNKIRDLHPDFEVIVIDDGSTDNTASVASSAGAHVHSHPYNVGNGAAIKTGTSIASGDVLIFMDGDGQHDPADIEKFVKFFPDYDMVVGKDQKNAMRL